MTLFAILNITELRYGVLIFRYIYRVLFARRSSVQIINFVYGIIC